MKEFIIYLTLGASAGLLSLAPSQPGSPASEPTAAPVVAPFPPSVVAHDALLDEPQTAVAKSTVPGQQVTWHEDLATARAEARRENKRLLVRFTAPWCAPCARHASQDSTAERSVILRQFVRLKVNVDRQPFWRLRGVPILKAKGIPYEAIYESDMTPVWAGNPLRARDYVPVLRRFGMRSVLRKVGRDSNPACGCSPCRCGPTCKCS